MKISLRGYDPLPEEERVKRDLEESKKKAKRDNDKLKEFYLKDVELKNI